MAWQQKERVDNANVGSLINHQSLDLPSLHESTQTHSIITNRVPEDTSMTSADDPLIQEFLKELIVHTFLPKKTPATLQANLEDVEQCMLYLAYTTLLQLPLPQREKTEEFLQNWKIIQKQLTSTSDAFLVEFPRIIKKLQIGESAAIYVRKQNCTILLTKFEGNSMQCVTYRSSLPNQVIMSTTGSLRVTFPETNDVVINQEFLHSQHFAFQLYELHTKEFAIALPSRITGGTSYPDTRDVPEPFLVSDWIIGQLVPGSQSPTTACVTKKLRDEIRLQPSASALPFRRSGMWTSIKIALALKIREAFKSADNASIVYKIVMLHILAKLAKYYSQEKDIQFDTATQILAKLGRRSHKLQNMRTILKVESKQTTRMIAVGKMSALRITLDVSTILKGRITKVWRDIHSMASFTETGTAKRILRTMENIKNVDTCHLVKFLDDHVLKRTENSVTSNKVSPGDVGIPLLLPRYNTIDSCLGASIQWLSDFDKKVWLNDMEALIKNFNSNEVTTSVLMKVFYQYLSNASSFYTSQMDPVGYSQMLLCLLKLVQTMDIIATREHPLLFEYASGIRGDDFDILLLPHVVDMNLLEEMINYFQDRDINAVNPAILSSASVSTNTFSVRYAMSNEAMRQLRMSILEETEKRTVEKHEEFEKAKKASEELLEKKILEGHCTCKWGYNEIRRESYKISTCRYCILEGELKYKRTSVGRYERPLPKLEYLQYSVVFELQIPEELSALRDILAIFNFEVLASSSFNKNDPQIRWEHYLSNHRSSSSAKVVKLWSDSLPASQTNFRRTENPDVFCSSKDIFVVFNGMNCVYFHKASGVHLTRGNAKDCCTFQIRNTSEMTIYENLQYTLADTKHTQNKVIASAFSCHRDLTVAEFISFGSLRSGHRIQLRNLFRSISNRTLTLEKEPVVALIMQTLWQLGPLDGEGCRDSHLDFLQNDSFTLEFLTILENVVDNNEQNYSNPYILLVVIVANTRIIELNSDCRSEGYKLLIKCRRLMEKWAGRIEKYISDELIQSSCPNLTSFKMRLLEISICSSFTYKVSTPSLIDTVVQRADEIELWLKTISRIHELISEGYNKHLSIFSKSLLVTARSVPFLLEKSKLFSSALKMDGCMNSFATQKWSKSRGCTRQTPWRKYKSCPNQFLCNYMETDTGINHILTFDFYQGIFLVDGYPPSSLPSQITDHELYRLYFHSIRFKIQRDSQTFRTVDPFHGSHYEFLLTSTKSAEQENQLIVREITADESIRELLNPSDFENKFYIIAPFFIHNYTHWLDVKKEVVYFKRRPTEDSHYDLPPDLTMSKVRSKWIFRDLKSQKCLLSINSIGFTQISKSLSRIEEWENINVLLDEKTGQVTALLPRYQLSFHLSKEGSLLSVEYPDYKISANQGLGTLVGLNQGIRLDHLLTGNDGTTIVRKMALIPHGHIGIIPGNVHQATRINLSNLRSPKFFAYEVDSVLKRLVGEKSKAAWLYLAALHAATSSSLPDPLTGLTGTEMAMWILQSAMVWSGSPYDEECRQTLKTISGFSPVRNFYGTTPAREDIEITRWPSLPEMVAFDGFRVIVDSLLEDSKRMAFLFPNSPRQLVPSHQNEGNKHLQIRAYFRSLPFYNQQVSLKHNYISSFQNRKARVVKVTKHFHPRQKRFCEQLFSISQILFSNDDIIHPSVLSSLQNCSLASYLIRPESLGAATEIKSFLFFPLEQMFGIDMRREWLRLYKYAISGASRENDEEKIAWHTYLSAMAYNGHPLEQIIFLHLISSFADVIAFPRLPKFTGTDGKSHIYEISFGEYSSPSENDFSRSEIISILNSKKVPFSHNTYERYHVYHSLKREYEGKQEDEIDAVVDLVASHWLTPYSTMSKSYYGSKTDFQAAREIINNKLNFWRNNNLLTLFVNEVESILKTEMYELVESRLNQSFPTTLRDFGKFEDKLTIARTTTDTLDVLQLERTLKSFPTVAQLESAITTFRTGNVQGQASNYVDLTAEIEDFLKIFKCGKKNTREQQILHVTGITPRVTPLSLSHLITNEKFKKKPLLYDYVGALVVRFANLKRICRCLRYESKGGTFMAELKREMENKGHENWSPAQHPEWLLLELELDLMIRPVQVEVARQMMEMPNGGNGVMQLNMGEGKTSVIVPMVCAALANENTLCRVTVLNSIFKTNFKILAFAIGGLLNRRVLTIPCRRDMKLSINDVYKIGEVYEECLRMKGVILTLPEYRLSFRLKIFDSIIKTEDELGVELLAVENWLRSYARDILDESDELLSVYTTGTQLPVDGGNLRWTICQDILRIRIVQQIASNMYGKHGSSVIEFDNENQQNHPEQFAPFRILKNSCHQEICNAIADMVLQEIMLKETLRELQRNF